MASKPRRWHLSDMKRKVWLAPPGEPIEGRAPVLFAYNDERGGVCAIVAMTPAPFVVTVVTRRNARQRKQLRKAVMQPSRVSGRRGRLLRYSRRISEAS